MRLKNKCACVLSVLSTVDQKSAVSIKDHKVKSKICLEDISRPMCLAIQCVTNKKIHIIVCFYRCRIVNIYVSKDKKNK